MVKRKVFFFLSCRFYPCCGLNLDFSPIPPSPQSVVRQSRLQLVWSVRGAPQGPSRPALLHPPPQLRVATVGCDPKQHSGEYPAQSSLIWLHRWVHAQHTQTHTRARERDTRVPFFLQMPVSSYLSISSPIIRAGTHTPTPTTKMMNFLSSACTVTLSACSEALQCTPKLHILSRGRRWRGWEHKLISETLHHVSIRLMLVSTAAVFINFNISFPRHSSRTKYPVMAETIAHLGADRPFFLCLISGGCIYSCSWMHKYFSIIFERCRAVALVFLWSWRHGLFKCNPRAPIDLLVN